MPAIIVFVAFIVLATLCLAGAFLTIQKGRKQNIPNPEAAVYNIEQDLQEANAKDATIEGRLARIETAILYEAAMRRREENTRTCYLALTWSGLFFLLAVAVYAGWMAK